MTQHTFCFSDGRPPCVKIITTYSVVAWWVNKLFLLIAHLNGQPHEGNVRVGRLSGSEEFVAIIGKDFIISQEPLNVRAWQGFNLTLKVQKTAFLSRRWLAEKGRLNSSRNPEKVKRTSLENLR